jgi:hypothetical protein
MHDVAVEMTRRGTRVIVFTADRGYEDPSLAYPGYEQRDGVHVVRVPWASLGKSSIPIRLVGGGVFLAEATALALLLRRIDHVLVSTSPPFCGLGGLTVSRARGVPLTYWVMDLNPDQIVATGALASEALPVRMLERMNQALLGHARHVVVLDRFMADRVSQKRATRGALHVIPPWSHIDADQAPIEHEHNAFRTLPAFGSARVVMYSGNLSPVHPIGTFLRAARAFAGEPRLRFVFVGGGSGLTEIERFNASAGLTNLFVLPYQPLERLRESLSAADVHLVAMGDSMVGIVHPCKVYGAMAVARPILALAPRASHIGELLSEGPFGWRVNQGDDAGMHAALRSIADATPRQLCQMGAAGSACIRDRFAKGALIHRFCDLLA